MLSQGGIAGAINDRGDVVGSNYDGTLADQSAFLWRDNRMKLMEFGYVNEATDVNNLGQVVGTSDSSEVYWANPRAFLWENGKKTELGGLGGGGSYAYAINDRGQVVGKAKTAKGLWHAFLWENGVMRDLGTLGGEKSEATAINERGQIVGSSTTATGHWNAVLWQQGTLRDLGTLGGYQSHATGINNAGEVVGYASTKPKGGQTATHAFVYQNGAMRDLGVLPGKVTSQAAAINNRGQIVGWSADKIGLEHAVLWTR